MHVRSTAVPIFSIAYLGEAEASATESLRHRVVYAGGGGSSKTGVGNVIVTAEVGEFSLVELCQLDTGSDLCSFVCVGRRQKTMLVSVFGNKFRLCKLSNFGKLIAFASDCYVSDLKDQNPSINCCAVNGAKDHLLAVGGDDGMLRIWTVCNEGSVFTCMLAKTCRPGHTSSITDCSFSESGHLVATSSKDGTCRVWSLGTGHSLCKVLTNYAMLPTLTDRCCRKTANFIVRACKFVGDDCLISVQSAFRGNAYAAKWTLRTKSNDECEVLPVTLTATRMISRHPVSAVGISGDFIAHGNVEGYVSITSTSSFAPVGGCVQAHELPVTALVVAGACTRGNASPCILSVSADYRLVATSLTHLSRRRKIICAALSVLFAILAVSLGPCLVPRPLEAFK